MSSQLQELTTVLDWVRWAASEFNRQKLFFGHGTDNAWDEALALVLHVLQLSHEVPAEIFQAHLTTDERNQLFDLIQKRIFSRLPLPYLTHSARFADLEFYVNEHVLIPRSPIAELIQKNFTPWVEPDEVSRILDLCTGSGCIAIACAMYFPESVVDAVDISKQALEVAEKNVAQFNLEQQVCLIESDLYNAVPVQQYDVIVSNPPYVSQDEFAQLPTEYSHEPSLALVAEEDGLSIVNRILKGAANYLSDNGILVVEVGNSEQALIERYPDVDFVWLEFERGGSGVFLLTKQQLVQYKEFFK